MKISQLNDIQTDVGEGVTISAAAIVGKAREIMTADQLEVILDGTYARSVVDTEPEDVPVRAARATRNGVVGIGSEVLGAGGGGVELRLHGRRTAVEGGPLAVNARDGEDARELDRGNVFNGGV